MTRRSVGCTCAFEEEKYILRIAEGLWVDSDEQKLGRHLRQFWNSINVHGSSTSTAKSKSQVFDLQAINNQRLGYLDGRF